MVRLNFMNIILALMIPINFLLDHCYTLASVNIHDMKTTGDASCFIDKSKSFVYLTFERIEQIKKGKKEVRLVWFRVKNNSSFELAFLSSGGSPLRIENGKLTTEIENGGPVSVYYEIETKKGKRPPFFCDNFFVFRIRPGFSFTFFIPEDQIMKSYGVVIPFWLSCEQPYDSYPVSHEVRYYWACQDDLPKEIKNLGKKKNIERTMKLKLN